MQVVEATRFGPPEVLEAGARPDPVPGPDEVVVDVELAEVLFLDTQLRAGWGREYFDLTPPFVPGVGVAGPVSSVGEDVDPQWIGRRVIASTSRSGEHAGGGYAERAVAPLDVTFAVPDELSLREAIAALHDGMMGVSRIERAQIATGARVLVTAAGGGIGIWLVPLARAAGATVVAAARGERKLGLAEDRGAHAVVDYSEPGWAARARDAFDGEDADVVFDGAGGELGRAAFEITASGGRFFSYGAASGDFPEIGDAERRGIRVVGIHDGTSSDDWRRYTRLALGEVEARVVEPVIGQSVALEDAAEAHAAIESRSVVGKTLLEVR